MDDLFSKQTNSIDSPFVWLMSSWCSIGQLLVIVFCLEILRQYFISRLARELFRVSGHKISLLFCASVFTVYYNSIVIQCITCHTPAYKVTILLVKMIKISASPIHHLLENLCCTVDWFCEMTGTLVEETFGRRLNRLLQKIMLLHWVRYTTLIVPDL